MYIIWRAGGLEKTFDGLVECVCFNNLNNRSLFDDFRKVKSFDIRPIEEGGVKVTKDDEKKNVYKISVPAFSDDDDSW